MRQIIVFARNSTSHAMNSRNLEKLGNEARNLLENEPDRFPLMTKIEDKDAKEKGEPSWLPADIEWIAEFVDGYYSDNQVFTHDPEQIKPITMLPSFQPRVFDIETLEIHDLRDFMIEKQMKLGDRVTSAIQVTDIGTYKIG